jgi:hypothetical protein
MKKTRMAFAGATLLTIVAWGSSLFQAAVGV